MEMISLILIASFLIIICLRAIKMKNPVVTLEEAGEAIPVKVDDVAQRLSKAIQKKTVSYPDISRIDRQPYAEFLDFLVESYPLVHRHLEMEKVNDYGLIYHLKGQNQALKPALLTAHYDVVPVEKSTLDDWEHPPFDGVIADGYVWGRGTMDMKLHLLSILEALEMQLAAGYKPQRDIYLAFGQDEETRGDLGACAIAKLFEERGLEFDFVLDEGGCITEGALPFLEKPLALIGIAEKGISSVRITVNGVGGHSSMPPKQTSVGALARIVSDLEKQQFDLRICEPVKKQFEEIGREVSFSLRLLIANLWCFGPLFKRVIAKSEVGNAMMRTTTAATVFEGSMAHNVLAPKASAIVNFRLIPGETVEDVLDHIRKVAGNQEVELEPMMQDNPSLISPTDSDGYRRIESYINKTFPGVLVSPFLVVGGTDSRRYEKVCPNIYRFSPMKIQKEDTERIHNVNERISLENIERSVRFFHGLISEL